MIVNIKTTKGDIAIKLYDETPRHKANFIELVNRHEYDGTLFHRVIKDFMIQAGDPRSKSASKGEVLGSGDLGYTIPAEFVYPKFYHKKGALAAARCADEVNPQRESSGCQFYIVTGKRYSERELRKLEKQLNEARVAEVFNREARNNYELIKKLRLNRDKAGLEELQDRLYAQALDEVMSHGQFRFTEEQLNDYQTIGGTPFLDGQYTVFGEVVKGMDIVDEIQAVATDRNDRPREDVRIIEMVVNDED